MAFRRVDGLGLVQLRFHVTLGDAVTWEVYFYVSMEITLGQF